MKKYSSHLHRDLLSWCKLSVDKSHLSYLRTIFRRMWNQFLTSWEKSSWLGWKCIPDNTMTVANLLYRATTCFLGPLELGLFCLVLASWKQNKWEHSSFAYAVCDIGIEIDNTVSLWKINLWNPGKFIFFWQQQMLLIVWHNVLPFESLTTLEEEIQKKQCELNYRKWYVLGWRGSFRFLWHLTIYEADAFSLQLESMCNLVRTL